MSGISTLHLMLALGVSVQGKGCPMIYPLVHPQPSSLQHSLWADGAACTAGLVLPSLRSAVKPTCETTQLCATSAMHSPAFCGHSRVRFLPELPEAADVSAELREVLTSQLLSSLPAQQTHCPLPAPHSAFHGFLTRLEKGLWLWQGFGSGHYRL